MKHIKKYSFLILGLLYSSFTIYAQTPVIQRALNHGLGQPQDPGTLPVSRSTQIAKPVKSTPRFKAASLELVKDNEYRIESGWKMQDANKVNETGELPFKKEYNVKSWYNATVPGTVLTTLVNEGVYPDPYIGLNNVQIPDTLCNTDWWYRVELNIPKERKSERITLILNGINYRAEIWFNQKRLGIISGAFIRGQFDVTALAKYDEPNVLAIRIIPPNNPGIAHEQSLKAGMGRNGGLLCLDGPTFFASEGWDWIPGIKDRNIGIWQDVRLKFHGNVMIGDPQIVTDLPLPDTSKVDLKIKIPVTNYLSTSQRVKVEININHLNVEKTVSLKPNEETIVTFAPSEFPQLTMNNPKLWWPNGYGQQNLYRAKFKAKNSDGSEDIKTVRFGVREYDYQLLVSSQEKEKVDIEFNPTAAYQDGNPVFDQVNVVQIDVKGSTNYISSLLCKTDAPGIKLAKNTASPYMVLKVNGVKVFCKGGNWGMEDAMKRISRERMESAFKLHKAQNFNMIRNWTGQSTEEVLFELSDEYGIMVFNDFWMSTTDYNLPPADYRLFMTNVKDAVRRFRNHPSIAIWCARNEGFAPEGLELLLTDMLVKEDGTRHYLGSSIKLNTAESGPWESHDPNQYSDPKSKLFPQGFKTEMGTASFPTYHTALKFIEKEDLWPIGDVWNYHDWHVNIWPGFEIFQQRVDTLYGKSENAEEFLGWAQLENLRAWKYMSEASVSNLWNNTTGFLYWMSHPAWYSTVWQTYTYDLETTGAYYGAMKACEPIHIQMSPTLKTIKVVNVSQKNHELIAKYALFTLEGKAIKSETKIVEVATNTLADCFDISSVQLPENKLSLLRLTLSDKTGKLISTNDYWLQGKGCSNFQSLKNIGNVAVKIQAIKSEKDNSYSIQIKNNSRNLALGVKLNLRNATTKEYVLPAFFSDGFFTMLPNEVKTIQLTDCKDLKGYEIVIEGLNIKK